MFFAAPWPIRPTPIYPMRSIPSPPYSIAWHKPWHGESRFDKSEDGDREKRAKRCSLKLRREQRLGGALQARCGSARAEILRRCVGALHQQEKLVGEAFRIARAGAPC